MSKTGSLLSLLTIWKWITPAVNGQGLNSWSLSPASLANNDYRQYAAYNEDSVHYSDCIWVFGGVSHEDIYCYNISNNTVTYWDDLDPLSDYTIREESIGASTIILDGDQDYLYFMEYYGLLFRYHLNTKELTLLTDELDTNGFERSCLAQNPANEDELLIVEGNSGGDFAIYTISSKEIEYGQSLPNPGLQFTCVMVDNYYYVFGGVQNDIQRIDVSSNDLKNEKWETLTTRLDTDDTDCDITWTSWRLGGAIRYNNLVYLVAGYDGSRCDCIAAFNVDDYTVSYVGDLPAIVSGFGLAIAKDRMYVLGGYSSSSSDSVYISGELSDSYDEEEETSEPFGSVHSFKEAKYALANSDRDRYAVYNEDSVYYSDCIWVFGGNSYEDIYCYNISNQTASYYDDLDPLNDYRMYKHSATASVIILDGDQDYIYFIDWDALLFRYHINTKELTLLSEDLESEGFEAPCMAQNPGNEDELLIVDGYSAGMFAIYTISTKTMQLGQSLHNAALYPACLAVNNEYYDNNPYFYVFGGNQNDIQRIDLSSKDLINQEWETLTTVLDVEGSNCDITWTSWRLGGAILHENLIYLMGGYDGSRCDCIAAFNLDDYTVSYYGDLPVILSQFGVAMAQNRIYLFGGYSSSNLDTVYISNELDNNDELLLLEHGELESFRESHETDPNGNNRAQFSSYNGDSVYYSDCIWVFGGYSYEDIYCFNITNETYQYYDDADPLNDYLMYQSSHSGSVIIADGDQDYMYVIDWNALLFRYHINTKELTLLTEDLESEGFESPCMAQNPANEDELLIVDGYNGGFFAIYTISTKTIQLGQSLDDAVFRPSCIMINNEYFDNDPYYYVFGGQSTKIQRIDVSSDDLVNEKWETLTTVLDLDNSDCDISWSSWYAGNAVLYHNYVYLIGGYDGANADCIARFDLNDYSLSYHGEFPTTIRTMTTTLAQDRIYIFGGYGYDTVYISDKMSESNEEPAEPSGCLESFKQARGTLANSDQQQYAAYNEDSVYYSDCVWVFGGSTYEDIYCYSISNQTVSHYDDLDPLSDYVIYEQSTTASLIILDGDQDYLYFIDWDALLFRYHINTKELTLLTADLQSEGFEASCMVQNPGNEDELLIVDGYNGGMFAIFTISTKSVEIGQSLNNAAYQPSCLVVNNEYYDNNPYLYVFGGIQSDIQRIDLSSNDLANEEWETLETTLADVDDSNCDITWTSYRLGHAILHENLVYLLGGYDGATCDCIATFNLEDESMSFYGELPVVLRSAGVTMAQNRVYLFGGVTSGTSDTIWMSNLFCQDGVTDKPTTSKPSALPTCAPTKSPTVEPTASPTKKPSDVPSESPTKRPTDMPSLEPSAKPTKKPTSMPSQAPTKRPTDMPSMEPSAKPTKQPTHSPTPPPSKKPTSMPSQAPTNKPTSNPTPSPSNQPTAKPTPAPVVTSAPTAAPTCGLYIGVAEKYQWKNASQYCTMTYGTALATIESENEFNLAIDAAEDAGFYTPGRSKARFWIGLNDYDDDYVYRWDDGSMVDFTNGLTLDPHGKCVNAVAGSSNGDYWDDIDCLNLRYVVCNHPSCA